MSAEIDQPTEKKFHRLAESVKKCWRALAGFGVFVALSAIFQLFGFANDLGNMFNPAATGAELKRVQIDVKKAINDTEKSVVKQIGEQIEDVKRNQNEIKRTYAYLQRDIDYCKKHKGRCDEKDIGRIAAEAKKQSDRSHENDDVLAELERAVKKLEGGTLAGTDRTVPPASPVPPNEIKTYITEEGDAIASSDFSLMEMSMLLNSDDSSVVEAPPEIDAPQQNSAPAQAAPPIATEQPKVNAWDTTTVFDVEDARALNIHIPAPSFDPASAAQGAIVLITHAPSASVLRVMRANGAGVGAGDTMTIADLQRLTLSAVQVNCSVIASMTYSVTSASTTDYAVATFIGNSSSSPVCQTSG